MQTSLCLIISTVWRISARVAVAVMPLLSKQVQVQRVEVNGLKATLVKRKDGTLNIADLLSGMDEKKEPSTCRWLPEPRSTNLPAPANW